MNNVSGHLRQHEYQATQSRQAMRRAIDTNMGTWFVVWWVAWKKGGLRWPTFPRAKSTLAMFQVEPINVDRTNQDLSQVPTIPRCTRRRKEIKRVTTLMYLRLMLTPPHNPMWVLSQIGLEQCISSDYIHPWIVVYGAFCRRCVLRHNHQIFQRNC
jgi:hypothetical protein